jgi:2-oxoglutarate/2-oxoacid ferredoxin oxidoreductase subunit alpha
MKQTDSLVIKICGSAGDGAISAVEILNRACALMGFHIMNFDSYPAEIRGFGKSVGHTRISKTPLLTPGRYADCLVALNDKHAITELKRIKPDVAILYDSLPPDYIEEDCAIAGFIEPGMSGYGVPLRELSTQAVKSARSRNIVALGAIAAIYNLDPEAFIEAINIRFARKPAIVREINRIALKMGHEYIQDHRERPVHKTLPSGRQHDRPIRIVNGNEAAATGALDAGVTLYAGYPITPATKIMEYLAKKLPPKGGTVVQTEDEIAAIGHVVGAGYAGKRAMTATSGPGLCLMTEMLNLAVQAEIACVLINSMRGGPSTGLPTKTEQSDLNLALYGGSGDSPRVVLAPANVPECYVMTRRAFEIAETFQTPVFLLLDFFLSNRFEDVDETVFETFEPGMFERRIAEPVADTPFERFCITDNGISPAAFPGMPGLQHPVTGLEHTPCGFPNYEGDNHRAMTEKRHRKFIGLKDAWPPPDVIGPKGHLNIGVISWGSSIGAVREALASLELKGLNIGGYFPRLLQPLQTAPLNTFANRCDRLVAVELNSSGQLAGLIERTTHKEVRRLADVPAEPHAVEEIVRYLSGVLK